MTGGLLAKFDGPEALVAAARGLREAGYTQLEAYSPVPIHGLRAAIGRRRSRLPWLVLAAGVTGAAVALVLQWWTNAVSYPYVISGKPLFSLPANIPITFELIILFSALAAFGGVVALCGLPRLAHPLLAAPRFRGVTTDAFLIVVEAADPRFDETECRELLRSLRADPVESYSSPATRPAVPTAVYAMAAVLVALSLLPPLFVARARVTRSASPRIHPVPDMDFQAKYLPQAAGRRFPDGRAMRPPVPGTVARGHLEADDHFYRGLVGGKPATTFPMPVTMELMQRGRQRYEIYCSPCHGLAGEGDGIVSARAFRRQDVKWIKPLSLQNQAVREKPVGQIFSHITNGIRTMPAYGPQIPPEDRWAIVLYVRALQRSQNASIDDVPAEWRDRLR